MMTEEAFKRGMPKDAKAALGMHVGMFLKPRAMKAMEVGMEVEKTLEKMKEVGGLKKYAHEVAKFGEEPEDRVAFVLEVLYDEIELLAKYFKPTAVRYSNLLVDMIEEEELATPEVKEIVGNSIKTIKKTRPNDPYSGSSSLGRRVGYRKALEDQGVNSKLVSRMKKKV